MFRNTLIMNIENEIASYIASNKQKTISQTVYFLTKLWNSQSLKSDYKFEAITKYVIQNLVARIFEEQEDDSSEGVIQLLNQAYPPGTISSDTMRDLVTLLMKLVQEKHAKKSIEICLKITTHENLKDFFKDNLKIFFKLQRIMIQGYLQTGTQDRELFSKIIAALYLFAKASNFSSLFKANVLVPLMAVTQTSTDSSQEALHLIKAVCFSKFSAETSIEKIFDESTTEEIRNILIDIFISLYKTNPTDIGKFLIRYEERFLSTTAKEEEFLSQTKKLFLSLKKQGIDLAPIKRLNPEIIGKFSSRINKAIDVSKTSMDQEEFLDLISSFLSCDPFLFENNIFAILTNSMLYEKSDAELEKYGTLLNQVIKIYGKDLNQFLKNLLKSIDEFSTISINKNRKRKSLNNFETVTAKKKVKLESGDSSDRHVNWNSISQVWPTSTSTQFAEMIAGLNFSNAIKIWETLNLYLAKELSYDIKILNENQVFKIDLACSLLSEFFVYTRIQEQIMLKEIELTSAVKNFNRTQHLFYETILNIGYNSRVMSAFIKVSVEYENFLSLFYYHSNPEEKTNFDVLFAENYSNMKNEWKIIEQRVRNFGKIDEKNNLTMILIQQHKKEQLFSNSRAVKLPELSSILCDEKQVEYCLKRFDTRSVFMTSLKQDNMKVFAQHLLNTEDDASRTSGLKMVSQSLIILDEFIVSLLHDENETSMKTILEILEQLPLNSASEESKRIVMRCLLTTKSEITDSISKSLIEKLVMNDCYKSMLKDFSIQEIVEKFGDIRKFSAIYHSILGTAVRRMTIECIDSFKWILEKGNYELILILCKNITEISITSFKGETADYIKSLKMKIIQTVIVKLEKTPLNIVDEHECEAFYCLVKLCSENSSLLEDDVKDQYIELLEKFIHKITTVPSIKIHVQLFLQTLKDSEKFNLKDQLMTTIVEALNIHLKSLLLKNMSVQNCRLDVETESHLFGAIKQYKTNILETSTQILRKKLSETSVCTSGQLIYIFKIYQITFNHMDKSSNAIVKSYSKFLEDFFSKAVALESPELMIQVLVTNNTLLAQSKFQLENSTIDDFFCLLPGDRVVTSTFNFEEFYRYYSAVGEMLFVVANVRQSFFKSRVSQFFIALKSLMEEIFFFKNKQSEEITPAETSLLLKLALQSENIMKVVAKNHPTTIKLISLYVVSFVGNILIQNPKTLSIGFKFKVNIKNICNQILSTFDDKTRKHLYSVSDETTREVYDGLFRELRKRT